MSSEISSSSVPPPAPEEGKPKEEESDTKDSNEPKESSEVNEYGEEPLRFDPARGVYQVDRSHTAEEVAEKLFAAPEIPIDLGKVAESASSWWSWGSSVASKVAVNVSEQAAKVAENVSEKIIASNAQLKQEHDSFVNDPDKNVAAPSSNEKKSLLPWEPNSPHSDEIRTRVLKLSDEDKTFTVPPPEEVDFTFDFNTNAHEALAMMEADPMLNTKRFKLVPKKISEPKFWRNYFYRVNLIKESLFSTATAEEDEIQTNHMENASRGEDMGRTDSAELIEETNLENDGGDDLGDLNFASEEVFNEGGEDDDDNIAASKFEDDIKAELGLGDDFNMINDEDLDLQLDDDDVLDLEERIKAELALGD